MVNPIVACSQISCSWDQDENINKAEKIITDAVKEGVNIFLLQELFSSPYFCSSQDPKFFKLAQPFENNYLIEKFSKIASKLSVVLPISFFEKDKNSYYNSVAIIDSNGEVLGKYRKSHIPQNPGYEEKYYFSPGNSGFKVWETSVCKIGVGVCWDQWFPECARFMALEGADLLLYPTVWPSRSMNSVKIPTFIEGKLGYYSLAGETSISNGSIEAAYEAVRVAISAVDTLVKDKLSGIFALCRPPGHHASKNQYGGFCFFYNSDNS